MVGDVMRTRAKLNNTREDLKVFLYMHGNLYLVAILEFLFRYFLKVFALMPFEGKTSDLNSLNKFYSALCKHNFNFVKQPCEAT